MDSQKMGKLIKTLRKETLTQMQLAEHMNISDKRYQNGNAVWDALIFRFSKLSGFDVDLENALRQARCQRSIRRKYETYAILYLSKLR